MELTGRIIADLEERSGVSQRSGNKWMVREYMIEVQDNTHVAVYSVCFFEIPA